MRSPRIPPSSFPLLAPDAAFEQLPVTHEGHATRTQQPVDAQFMGLTRQRRANRDAGSSVAIAPSGRKKQLAVRPSVLTGQSSTHSVAAGGAKQQGAAATPSFLCLPLELQEDILLRVAASEPQNTNDLGDAARVSRAFYAVTRKFLEAPAARAAVTAHSHMEFEDAYQEIRILPPILRIRHAAKLLERWPQLSAEDQVTAIPTLMATLDCVSEVAKLPTLGKNDPFAIAAAALRRLRTVRAADLGFDAIFSRITKLPLAKMPILIAHREGNLCFSIPKLSLGRRLGAFDQMLNESADRITQDGHRYGFLHCLPPVLPSLAAADQQSAAQRLFQKAETGGNAENQIYTMLTAVPLESSLAPGAKSVVFETSVTRVS